MKGFLSNLLKFFVVFLAICGVFLGLLPTIASTDWGRTQVIRVMNRSIPGTIDIRKLQLHWGKNQVIEGIVLKDINGQNIVEIEKLAIEASLWDLLHKSTHLGFTEIHDLHAEIITNDKGETNLQRALGISSTEKTRLLLPSTIILSDMNAELYLFAKDRPLSAKIAGTTQQGNIAGSFALNIECAIEQINDWQNLKKNAQNYLTIEGSKTAKVNGQITNFPVDLIDRLATLKNPKLNGFFRALLGDRLNLTIEKEPNEEGLAFQVTAASPLMQGNLRAKVIDGILSLEKPAVFQFQLLPESINSYTQHLFTLTNPSHLNISFPILSLPLSILDSDAITDPRHIGFQTDIQLSETTLDTKLIGRATISLTPKNDEEWIARLSLQTPHLSLPDATFRLGKHVVLMSPATLSWNVPANLLQQITKREEVALDQAIPVQIHMKQIEIPLESIESTKYAIECTIPELAFSKLHSLTKLQMQDMVLKISGTRVDACQSEMSGNIQLTPTDAKYVSIFQEPLHFTQTSTWKINPNNKLEVPSIHFEMKNSHADIGFSGLIDSDLRLVMTQPAYIHYTMEPSTLRSIGLLLKKNWPTIKKPSRLQLTMDRSTIDINKFSLASLKILGSLTLDQVALEDLSGTASTLETIDAHWVFDAPMNNFYATAKGLVYTENKSSPLSAHIQCWPEFTSLSRTQAEFRLHCAGLPTSFVNVLFNTDDMSPIIGPILDVDIQSFFDPTNVKPGYWDILLDSANLHLKGRFKLENGVSIFNPKKYPTMRLSVTPQSYNYLKQFFNLQNEKTLLRPFVITCDLTDFHLPFKDSQSEKCALAMNFSSTNIEWRDAPTSTEQLQGKIFIDGKLKKGIFTLNQPLEVETKMTPFLSQMFLQDTLFLSSAIDSENPISLTIDPHGFSCSFSPFRMEEMHIGKGTIHLGKIRSHNSGELRSILQIIRPIDNPYITVWFTPIYFHIEKGQLSLQRCDMLVANAYTLATWGVLDLQTHEMQLILGLSNQTLQHAFGVQGLDESYLLQIPLRTHKGKLEFDKKKIATKIAATLAQTRIEKGNLLGELLDIVVAKEIDPPSPLATTQPFPWHQEFSPPTNAKITTETSLSLKEEKNRSKETKSGHEKKKKHSSKDLQKSALQLLDHLLEATQNTNPRD